MIIIIFAACIDPKILSEIVINAIVQIKKTSGKIKPLYHVQEMRPVGEKKVSLTPLRFLAEPVN